MLANEYQVFTRTTAIYPKEQAIEYVALGLASEAGEVAGKIKKKIRDGVFDRSALAHELGDILWYVARLADELDIDLADVFEMNIEKLQSRLERNALQGAGDDR